MFVNKVDSRESALNFRFPTLKTVRTSLKARRRFAQEIAALRTWDETDERKKAFYSQFVPRGGIVFDVGANVGNRAKVFATLARRVIAFEPQPYCQSVLREGLKDQPGVTVVPAAVGSANGRARMQISSAHTLSSMDPGWIKAVTTSGRFAQQSWDRQIDVEVVTLEQAIGEYGQPDFIKIDVEGFEAEVLKGLTNPVSALSFEFVPEVDGAVRACLTQLNRLGRYEYNLAFGETMQLGSPNWLDTEEVATRVANYGADVSGDIYARLKRA